MVTIEAAEWRADLIERAEPTDEWFGYVRGAGIDVRYIYAHASLLAVTRCEFLSGGRFDWADGDDGEPAAVVEVVEIENGEPVTVDLVAWSIAEPARFGLAMGRAPLLGGDQLINPASFFAGEPLQVWRAPLSWVRARCRGVVLLIEKCGPARLAGAIGKLAAEDLEHARQIDRLCYPWLSRRKLLVPISKMRGVA